MIIGECPYCNATVTNGIADECPAFTQEDCESCGKTYWLKHSRIDPTAYTLEDFAKEYDVNEETMTITERTEPDCNTSPQKPDVGTDE